MNKNNKELDPEYFNKYISHHNIKDYFNNNKDRKTMKLWTSFVGHVTRSGRRHQWKEL